MYRVVNGYRLLTKEQRKHLLVIIDAFIIAESKTYRGA